MTTANAADARRPKRRRERRSHAGVALKTLFALFGAATVWFAYTQFGQALTAQVCFREELVASGNPATADITAAFPWLMPALIAATIIAIIIGIAATLVAWRNWRSARGAASPNGQEPSTASYGRKRFLAAAGLLLSGYFLIGIAAGALGVVLVAPCDAYGATSGQSQQENMSEGELSDSELIAQGAYLARLGDCAGCHTDTKKKVGDFAGGLALGSPLGTIYSTNITPDLETGIGRYSYSDFDRAVRHGIARGGKQLYPAMPYPSFTKMADADLRALYAYFMHGVTPVNYAPPQTKLPLPFNQRWGLALWNAVFTPDARFKPRVDDDRMLNRGAYIVQSLGHCGACHTPRGVAFQERGYDESSRLYLTGGLNDNWFAPNLRGDPGSGLGRMSLDDIMSFLQTGHGSQLNVIAFGSMAEVVERSGQHFREDDLLAVARYLKSLEPEKESGAYEPASTKARQTEVALKTGDVQRPGAGVYMSHCAKCHHADGRGEQLKYPMLAGNPAVLAPDATSIIRLVLEGGRSPQTQNGPKQRKMPDFADKLTDTEIARVLTFVRSTWGNKAAAVTTRDVRVLRERLD